MSKPISHREESKINYAQYAGRDSLFGWTFGKASLFHIFASHAPKDSCSAQDQQRGLDALKKCAKSHSTQPSTSEQQAVELRKQKARDDFVFWASTKW